MFRVRAISLPHASEGSPEFEWGVIYPLPGTFTSVIAEADPGELILSDVPVFEELLNGGGSQEDGQEDTSTPPESHSFLPSGMFFLNSGLLLLIRFSGIRLSPWVGVKGHTGGNKLIYISVHRCISGGLHDDSDFLYSLQVQLLSLCSSPRGPPHSIVLPPTGSPPRQHLLHIPQLPII